jgi:hypothetical protein
MAFRLNFLSCCFKKVSNNFPAWHILCCYFSLIVKRVDGKSQILTLKPFKPQPYKGDKATRKTISFITFSIFLIVTPFVFAQGAPGEGMERKGERVEKRGNALEKRGERVERRGEKLEKEGEMLEKQGYTKEGERLEKKGETMEEKGKKLKRKGERKERRGEHLEKKGERMENRGGAMEKKN